MEAFVMAGDGSTATVGLTAYEKRLAEATRTVLEKHRLLRRPFIMMVYVMARFPEFDYQAALADWAAYEEFGDGLQWSASRWNTEFCYWLLKTRADVPNGVAAWFADRVKEVWAIADGVSS